MQRNSDKQINKYFLFLFYSYEMYKYVFITQKIQYILQKKKFVYKILIYGFTI